MFKDEFENPDTIIFQREQLFQRVLIRGYNISSILLIKPFINVWQPSQGLSQDWYTDIPWDIQSYYFSFHWNRLFVPKIFRGHDVHKHSTPPHVVCVGASCRAFVSGRGSLRCSLPQPTTPIIPVKTASDVGSQQAYPEDRPWDFPHDKVHVSPQLSAICNDSLSQDRDSSFSFAFHCGYAPSSHR